MTLVAGGDRVRSKYPNVLKPWVMYPTRRTCVGERYASNMDRVTLCYFWFGILFPGLVRSARK